MKHKPSLIIRMGASEWTVTAVHNNTEHKFDMRKLDTKTRRAVIFKVVEAVRVLRDAREKLAA